MTKDEFSRCVAMLEVYWPHGNAKWTVQAIELWEGLLLDLDPVPVAAAIQALAIEGRDWPPPPGLIRRRAVELADPIPQASEAWLEVCTWIRKVGSYRDQDGYKPVVWSHPLIGHVADTLGWTNLCQSENPVADRAHFFRLWEQSAQRHRADEALPEATRRALNAQRIQMPNLAFER